MTGRDAMERDAIGRDAERLSAHLDGELGRDEAAALARALAKDPALRAGLDGLRAADDGFRAAARAALAAPGDGRAAETIRRGFAARRARGRIAAFARWAAPLAASVAIVAGGLVWIDRRAAERDAARDAETARLIERAVQSALETSVSGDAVVAHVPDGAARVEVVPIRTFRSQSRRWCREFEERVTLDGRSYVRFGLACREPDGGWRRLAEDTPSAPPAAPPAKPRI